MAASSPVVIDAPAVRIAAPLLALRRLGCDTARVESWACDLAQALLTVLAQAGRRPFAALEEALLVQELVRGQGLSEREVARRSGRDVSWVSRRLALVCGLSDSILAAVRQGAVSTQLLAALAATPLSTRELHTWFQHYLNASSAARERMVAQPRLFIQSLRAQEEQRADTHLAQGPEGRSIAEFRQLLALIKRVRQRLPGLRREVLPDSLRTPEPSTPPLLKTASKSARRPSVPST